MILILTEVMCYMKIDDIKNKIDTNNLVNKFSGSENKSIDFKNYQLRLKLFIDL